MTVRYAVSLESAEPPLRQNRHRRPDHAHGIRRYRHQRSSGGRSVVSRFCTTGRPHLLEHATDTNLEHHDNNGTNHEHHDNNDTNHDRRQTPVVPSNSAADAAPPNAPAVVDRVRPRWRHRLRRNWSNYRQLVGTPRRWPGWGHCSSGSVSRRCRRHADLAAAPRFRAETAPARQEWVGHTANRANSRSRFRRRDSKHRR